MYKGPFCTADKIHRIMVPLPKVFLVRIRIPTFIYFKMITLQPIALCKDIHEMKGINNQNLFLFLDCFISFPQGLSKYFQITGFVSGVKLTGIEILVKEKF